MYGSWLKSVWIYTARWALQECLHTFLISVTFLLTACTAAFDASDPHKSQTISGDAENILVALETYLEISLCPSEPRQLYAHTGYI